MAEQPPMSELLNNLRGRDSRSIFRTNEVVEILLCNPELLVDLFERLENPNTSIRIKTTDALKKISVKHPDWLEPYRERLLNVGSSSGEQEVQWHVAQILGRLDFPKSKLPRAINLLKSYLSESDSRIVKAFALEALANQAERHPHLRPKVLALVQKAARSNVPLFAARAKRLKQDYCHKWVSYNVK